MMLFKRTPISLLITLLGTGCVLAAPVAQASTVMECPGVSDQFSAGALDPANVDSGKKTTALKPTRNVGTNDECATYMATNGTVNVQIGGTTGNVIVQNSGVVNVQIGGTVNGVIAAGNDMEAKDGMSRQYGGVGTVDLASNSTTAGVLIGDGSTLIANGADIGWVKTAGTTTLTETRINPSEFGLGDPGVQYHAGLEIEGGTTTIQGNSVINMHDTAVADPTLMGIDVHSDKAYAGRDPIEVHVLDTSVNSGTGLSITRDASEPDVAYNVDLKNSTFLADSPITTSGPSGTGAYVSVTGGAQAVTITSANNHYEGSSGLQFISQGASTTFTDTGSTFSADNGQTTQNAYGAGAGIYASGQGQMTLSGSTVRGRGDGILLDNLAKGNGGTVDLTDDTTVTAHGDGAALHFANNGKNARAENTVVIESGSTLDASHGNGNIIEGGSGASAQVQAKGVALNGNILARDTGTFLLVDATDQASITGTFNASAGATLALSADNGTFNGGLNGAGAGAAAEITLDNAGVMNGGAQATNGGTVRIQGSGADTAQHGTITADAGTVSLHLDSGAQSDGGMALSNGAQGVVSLSNAGTGLSRADGAAVSVDNSSAIIEVLDGAQLQGQDGALVNVTNGGSVQVRLWNTMQAGNMTAADGTLDLKLEGDAQLDGNVSARKGSVVLADNAVLNGNVAGPTVTVGGAATLDGNLDVDTLTLADSGTWKLGSAAAEALDTLAMNGGTVDFNSSNGNFKTLSATMLNGSGGTVAMNVDFNPGGGNDQLQVATVDGAHGLKVNSEQGVEHPRNDITLIQTGGGSNGSFNLVGDGKTDAGIYVYDVKREGNQWELVQTGTAAVPEPTDPTDPTDPVNPNNPADPGNPAHPTANPNAIPQPKNLSPAAKTALSVASSLPYAFYGELDTLRQREGDLRLNKAGSGLWVRSFATANKMAQSAAPAYDLEQYGGAFGADKRFVLPAGGDVYVGAFGSYSYNASDIDGGSSGRTNSAGTGAYATWMSQGGWYVDGTVKVNSFGNELRVVGDDGSRTRGKYDNAGFGGSIEVGKHFDLPDKGFIEPYSQIAAFRGGSVDKTLDNGFRIHDDPIRSLRGQLGLQAGTTFEAGKGYLVQPYMKAAVLREFVNSNHVALNGTTLSDNLNGNRALVGLGVQAQLKQNLQIHADVDYTSGGPVNHSVSGDLGLRYAF